MIICVELIFISRGNFKGVCVSKGERTSVFTLCTSIYCGECARVPCVRPHIALTRTKCLNTCVIAQHCSPSSDCKSSSGKTFSSTIHSANCAEHGVTMTHPLCAVFTSEHNLSHMDHQRLLLLSHFNKQNRSTAYPPATSHTKADKTGTTSHTRTDRTGMSRTLNRPATGGNSGRVRTFGCWRSPAA